MTTDEKFEKLKKKTPYGQVARISEAIADIKAGKMIIVTDSENRENEGDIVFSAQDATPEMVNFMAAHARGLICVPVAPDIAKNLQLDQMVSNNQDILRTAFTISVDSSENITTGISAADRALTIQRLADPASTNESFIKPGHIFPLVAKKGGVLVRAGHTEASVDLMKMAGKAPVGVICEIMNEDGTMARMPDLQEFAKKYEITMVTIKDLIDVRRRREKLVRKVAESKLPTEYGDFVSHAFESDLDGKVHLALTMGDVSKNDLVLVRVHSECLTGDVFHSLRCDCGSQLNAALRLIAENGSGVLLYMRQEGRGIGLVNKIKAYQYQDEGLDTVEANEKLGFPPDLRDYGIGAQILISLGIKRITLMTNNPRKIVGLEGYGLEISDRKPLIIEPNKHNEHYLKTKRSKLGHMLNQ